MDYESMDINTLIKLVCLQYLGDDGSLAYLSVNDLVIRALAAYLNA